MYNYLFRFEPANCFCSKLIAVQRRVQEPHNIYDGALCNNCEQLKVDYYGEVPHLGMAGFMDQSLTINRDC